MDIRFDEYNAYPESDIVSVTEMGITLSTGQFIDFAQCAQNFQCVHGGSGKCVGERDVAGDSASPSIAFYTAPLTTHIVFVGGGWFRPSPERQFRKLCQQIADAGYTTYDGS